MIFSEDTLKKADYLVWQGRHSPGATRHLTKHKTDGRRSARTKQSWNKQSEWDRAHTWYLETHQLTDWLISFLFFFFVLFLPWISVFFWLKLVYSTVSLSLSIVSPEELTCPLQIVVLGCSIIVHSVVCVCVSPPTSCSSSGHLSFCCCCLSQKDNTTAWDALLTGRQTETKRKAK